MKKRSWFVKLQPCLQNVDGCEWESVQTVIDALLEQFFPDVVIRLLLLLTLI